ncbi:MAG: HAMP domain-containing sensor histidine kinase, partial [Schlesneria sp.]
IEIDASVQTKAMQVGITPTKRFAKVYPDARSQRFDVKRERDLPLFQARIYVREGNEGARTFQAWAKQACGIRVYFEGFRVLPYGEPKNDWLQLDADYKTRSRTLTLLDEKGFEPPVDDPDEALVFIGNSAFFGGVFLTAEGSSGLKMLVNREGFVSGTSFDSLVDALRTAVYLSVRVRAAAKKPTRQKRRLDRSQVKDDRQEDVVSRLELSQAVGVTIERAAGFAREAKALAATGNVQAAANKIDDAAAEFSKGAEVSERLMTEGKILRVMASVGTQMTAFVHEIRSILGMSQALEAAVSEISTAFKLPATHRRRLAELRSAISDLRRGIERQASYLVDIVSPDARRRRSRQKLAERLEAACRIVAGPAARRHISIENDIPAELKSPLMFPAELTVIFSNLLTNAVKACEDMGRIRATGEIDSEGNTIVRIENSGVSVDLKNAERWFRPFESTTTDIDPILGQGMGMGLPITRNLLEEYGAQIEFVRPSRNFATAIQIIFLK